MEARSWTQRRGAGRVATPTEGTCTRPTDPRPRMRPKAEAWGTASMSHHNNTERNGATRGPAGLFYFQVHFPKSNLLIVAKI